MQIRTIFFGSSVHSLPALKKLLSLDYINIVACVTQPNRPVGRKQKITSTPVSRFAKRQHLPLITPPSDPLTPWLYLNPKGLTNDLAKLKPDLLITTYYGQKIPKEILKLPKYGGLNIHPSLLPKYRGASPVEWAILNAEREIGVTVLTLAENFDSGKIIAQEKMACKNTDTPEDLYKVLFEKGAELLVKILPDYLKNRITPKPQDNSKVTLAPRLKKDDGKINWLESPEKVDRKIKAFYPWPGTFTFVQLNRNTKPKRLKLLKSHVDDGKLIVEIVQLEGKKPVAFKVFQKAYPDYHFV